MIFYASRSFCAPFRNVKFGLSCVLLLLDTRLSFSGGALTDFVDLVTFRSEWFHSNMVILIPSGERAG
jgi:hypothetical protein